MIKTDAPVSAIWDIFRAYFTQSKENPRLEKLEPNHPKRKILADEQGTTTIDFTLNEDVGFNKLKNCIRFANIVFELLKNMH